MVDLAVHLLDQAHHIAHAEDARGHALRIERLERLGLLPDAQEHDRLAGHLAHRQRRTAARIAIRLGEDDAGEIERGAEGARGVHRILARHGIDHEQALGGRYRRIDVAHLAHQASSTCRRPAVSTIRTSKTPLRARVERRGGDGRRRAAGTCREVFRAHLGGQALQLQHGGRAAHVGAHQEHALLVAAR